MGAFISWGDRDPFKSISFDIVTSETPVLSNTITEHPVEEGANVADHIRPNLDTLSMEVFVSNTPLTGGVLVDTNGVGQYGLGDRGFVNGIVTDVPTFADGGTMGETVEVRQAPPVGLGGLLNQALSSITPARVSLALPPIRTTTPLSYTALEFAEAFNAPRETWEALRELKQSGTLVQVISRDWYLDNMAIQQLTEPRTAEEGTGAKFSIEFRQVRIVRTRQTVAPIPTEARANGGVGGGAQGPQPTAGNTPAKKSLLASLFL